MTAIGNSLNAQQHESVKINDIISIWSQFRPVCLGLGGIPHPPHTHPYTRKPPPLISNSLSSARSPTIELNSDTVYLEIPQVEDSFPRDCFT